MSANYKKLEGNMSHGLDFPNGKSGGNKLICSHLTMLTLKVKVVRPEQIRLLIFWGFRGRAPRREGSTQRSAGAGGDFPLLNTRNCGII